ncbi:MAG: RNA polymerase factor sigma-54 [Helicobacteraceae bacterium]|jgi:RNA polymerase sigma-54 factor|nr:RNA polymerase factor sigma-54 [Helicobacteraceae bacterium]
MKLKPRLGPKERLNAAMRNWLPLLQTPVAELAEKLREETSANPFLRITPNNEVSYDEPQEEDEEKDYGDFDDYYPKKRDEEKGSVADAIEATALFNKSLYDHLADQVTDHLFPTAASKACAYEIIRYIDENGFFDGDIDLIARNLCLKTEFVEEIRTRFEHLTPCGVGARDLTECFLFQLREYDIPESLYLLVKTFITDRENISKHHKDSNFAQAITIFKRFRNPPAIEFLEDSVQVIPDLFVFEENGTLEVRLNERYYPTLEIEKIPASFKKEEFIKAKLKEARDLIDAVNMRKATLYKVGLMIVEHQYDFFRGNEIKPMRLSDISEDLGRNPSTISRAISGKYLACNRGVFPLKSFFSISIDDISTRAIKDFLSKLIKEEARNRPLSDQKILQIVQEKFNIRMVRRTITKYREQMGIATSGERKRLYLLG